MTDSLTYQIYFCFFFQNPADADWGPRIQRLANNATEIQTNLRHLNRTISVTSTWFERRRDIISLLNKYADSLTQLNITTHAVDLTGSCVSLTSGVVVGVCLTGLVALPIVPVVAGVGILGGTATSFGAQAHNELTTKKRLRELRYALRLDQESLEEITRLVGTLNNVLARLDDFLPILKALSKVGSAAWNCWKEMDPQSSTYRRIMQLVSDDNLRTYVTQLANAFNQEATGTVAPYPLDVIDWKSEIGVCNKAITAIMALNLARKIGTPPFSLEGLTTTARVTRCAATCFTAVLLGISIISDLYHIKKIGFKAIQPLYIEELRNVAKQLQQSLDREMMENQNEAI